MKPTYSADIFLLNFGRGSGSIEPVYEVTTLGGNYDSLQEAVRAAMIQTRMYSAS
jgi:hypothetical protein